MLESMVEWMNFPLYYAFEGAPPPPRAGAAHATIFPYGPFAAGDGKSVMLGVQNEREWQAFCAKVLQRPELASDPRFDSNARRVAARDALAAIIDEVFSKLSGEQVVAAPGAGADRQRARQRHSRGVGASATGGARPLDRGGARQPAPIPAPSRRRCRASFEARMDADSRARRSTPMRCSPNSAFDDATVARWRTRRRGVTAGASQMATRFPGVELARFAATLRLRGDPAAVIARTQDLLLDWIGSALAGKGARPVESIASSCCAQGPATVRARC